MKEFKYTFKDGLEASCTRVDRENPKAVVQIIHGLKEHNRRYYHIAEYLNNNGYAVFMSDNRGHGCSVNDNFPLGYMTDLKLMVEDQYELTKYIKTQYPNTPVYILGHSFGSMLARCYIQDHDDEISKLVLSGTVGFNKLVYIAYPLSRIIIKLKGPKGRSKILEAIADNDDISWVCSNEETMEKYRNDHFCTGYKYMNASFETLFKAMNELHNVSAYKCKNPSMPILSIAGENDPVTKGFKGIEDSINTLKKIGYSDITSIIYENMLHEVLNETGKEKVYKDLLNFLDQ